MSREIFIHSLPAERLNGRPCSPNNALCIYLSVTSAKLVMSGIQLNQYQRIGEPQTSVVGKSLRDINGKNPSDLSKNFSILRKCKDKFDGLVHEMLLIKQYKPNLNGQSDSFRSKLFSMSH